MFDAKRTTAHWALLFVGGCGSPAGPGPSASSGHSGASSRPADDAPALLLMSRTAGYRHASIPNALEALDAMAQSEGWQVEATEDAARFSKEGLAEFDAVVFVSTTGDILNEAEQAAFEDFIHAGGGFVGIHAAADTEPDWPFYRELLGTHFSSHPDIQVASLFVEDDSHPATAGIPNPWSRRDEWYNFDTSPRAEVHVLLRLDEASYQGGTMGDHPIAWTRQNGDQRAFYTALGHTTESYTEAEFLGHLRGGIAWVLGAP